MLTVLNQVKTKDFFFKITWQIKPLYYICIKITNQGLTSKSGFTL